MKTHLASNLFRLLSSVVCLLVASTAMAQSTDIAPPSSDVPGASSASPAAPPGEVAPPPPGSYPPAPAAYPPPPGFHRLARTNQEDIESSEPAEEAETAGPRTLAIGITTIKEHGFGAVVRARANHVGMDVAVGFVPILIVESGSSSAIDFGMPLHVSAGPVFFFNNDQARFQNGIRINGIYNRALGPGGGLGWVGEITKRHFTIAFGAGLQIFPQATRRVKEYFPDLEGGTLESTPPPEVQLYVGVNHLWYLI